MTINNRQIRHSSKTTAYAEIEYAKCKGVFPMSCSSLNACPVVKNSFLLLEEKKKNDLWITQEKDEGH